MDKLPKIHWVKKWPDLDQCMQESLILDIKSTNLIEYDHVGIICIVSKISFIEFSLGGKNNNKKNIYIVNYVLD